MYVGIYQIDLHYDGDLNVEDTEYLFAAQPQKLHISAISISQ